MVSSVMLRYSVFPFLLSFFLMIETKKADLIIFSFDRPLQLYAFLESVELYAKNASDVRVIYRVSDNRYARAYDQVQKDFPNSIFIKQSNDPSNDFKKLLIKSLSHTGEEHIVFAVDDIIVKDYVDFSHCIQLMEQCDAYGFFLRLGKNITYCYAMNKAQKVPALKEVGNSVYAWQFGQADYDWGYPNTVDMTIYRKKDVEGILKSINYKKPNDLEALWASCSYSLKQKMGLCYESSKIVNVPLNRVQNYFSNRHMGFASPEELLGVFESGFKIDIRPLHKIENISPHMEYEPQFIKRDLE